MLISLIKLVSYKYFTLYKSMAFFIYVIHKKIIKKVNDPNYKSNI